jgi:predicted nucleotidyltransferase
MDRNELIDRIRTCSEAIRAEGATALYVHGSRARGDNRPDSDLDVYVEYVSGTGFSSMSLAGIYNILSERTVLDVSITTRNSLHPKLKDTIERESVQIF